MTYATRFNAVPPLAAFFGGQGGQERAVWIQIFCCWIFFGDQVLRCTSTTRAESKLVCCIPIDSIIERGLYPKRIINDRPMLHYSVYLYIF